METDSTFLTLRSTPDNNVETRVNLVFDDPFMFGMALVDAARVIAQAFANNEGGLPDAYLDRIKEGIDAEWDRPTTNVTMKPLT